MLRKFRVIDLRGSAGLTGPFIQTDNDRIHHIIRAISNLLKIQLQTFFLSFGLSIFQCLKYDD